MSARLADPKLVTDPDGHFPNPDPRKPRRHKVVRTEILGRMVRSRNSQALTGITFVTISLFVSRSPKVDADPRKGRRCDVVRTEILWNGPVDEFTALTGTTFVTFSVFMSRGAF